MPRTRMNWRQNLSQRREVQQPQQPKIQVVDPLAQEARMAQISRAQAAEAHARYQMGKEIETDRQRTAFYNGLQELEQKAPPIGTKEHAEAYAAYAHEFPLARSSADVNQMLKLHATVNDEQAALKQRIIDLSPPPEKIAQRYARVQGDIQQFTDESSQQEAANIAAGKANVQYTNAPKLHAAQTEAQLLETQYPTLTSGRTAQTSGVSPTESATGVAAIAAPSATPTPIAEATTSTTPHPLEGQTVRNKTTGVMGVITNGQFIPNDEQQQ